MNFLSVVQFGSLKTQDTVPPLPKAKLSKRAHLWFGIQIVGPPVAYFVRLRQGTPDALEGYCNGEFFDNGCHRCSFPLNVAVRLYLTYRYASCFHLNYRPVRSVGRCRMELPLLVERWCLCAVGSRAG